MAADTLLPSYNLPERQLPRQIAGSELWVCEAWGAGGGELARPGGSGCWMEKHSGQE